MLTVIKLASRMISDFHGQLSITKHNPIGFPFVRFESIYFTAKRRVVRDV